MGRIRFASWREMRVKSSREKERFSSHISVFFNHSFQRLNFQDGIKNPRFMGYIYVCMGGDIDVTARNARYVCTPLRHLRSLNYLLDIYTSLFTTHLPHAREPDHLQSDHQIINREHTFPRVDSKLHKRKNFLIFFLGPMFALRGFVFFWHGRTHRASSYKVYRFLRLTFHSRSVCHVDVLESHDGFFHLWRFLPF